MAVALATMTSLRLGALGPPVDHQDAEEIVVHLFLSAATTANLKRLTILKNLDKS